MSPNFDFFTQLNKLVVSVLYKYLIVFKKSLYSSKYESLWKAHVEMYKAKGKKEHTRLL